MKAPGAHARDQMPSPSQRARRPGQLVLRPDLEVTGIQVFSATMPAQRANLGEVVTAWIAAHPNIKIVDVTVTQSSDSDFHCLSITLTYWERASTR